ncbi:LGFP repeat-containing protein [Cellulomonas sp. HZM]|uniref:LGFP repeat-containing protein n=1 Tax=Cellulomonas sp. HZM TaxID=1454010 RepID=UPI0004938849|nr:hypothetical protein [Cellulomonas sp. HZM]
MGRVLAALVVVLGLGGTTLVAAPESHAATKAATKVVTTKATSTTYRTGESVWFTGRVTKGSAGVASAQVQLVRRTSTTRTVLATFRTTSTGRFAVPATPTGSAEYYVRTTGSSSVHGPVLEVAKSSTARTLAARAKDLAGRLGDATTGTRRVAASRVKDSGVTSVRYKDFERGMLVEVVRSGVTRTWFVPGKIRDRYVAKGRMTGTFGVPRADARCVVLESGCTQQFAKVAAYASSTTKIAHYQAGSGARAQYLAAARSQVGYREPAWRKSKYNAWFGYSAAWCGTFQSWVSAAIGRPGVVPARSSFDSFVAASKKAMTDYKPGSSRKPKVGTLVFFDFRNASPKKASHVGLLLSRSGDDLVVLEGNSSKGTRFTDARGVYVHHRSAKRVLFYADPRW